MADLETSLALQSCVHKGSVPADGGESQPLAINILGTINHTLGNGIVGTETSVSVHVGGWVAQCHS